MCKILLIVKRILLCNLANWKDFYLLTYFCVALVQGATNNYSLTAQLQTIWLQTLEEVLDNKRFISVLKLEQFSIICKVFSSSQKEYIDPIYCETFSNVSITENTKLLQTSVTNLFLITVHFQNITVQYFFFNSIKIW